ncbi:hypothetical protein, partial [Paenibacillus sp. NPDC058071]|uniref:hypothetical protein n=1 Tax=Paenibacillus sp. NPDC058071 TaxID=3346326 RepID=UPI0036DC03F4
GTSILPRNGFFLFDNMKKGRPSVFYDFWDSPLSWEMWKMAVFLILPIMNSLMFCGFYKK